jgi:hypothetical protein
MIRDFDFRQVIDPDIFSDPAEIPDAQPPRELHT